MRKARTTRDVLPVNSVKALRAIMLGWPRSVIRWARLSFACATVDRYIGTARWRSQITLSKMMRAGCCEKNP